MLFKASVRNLRTGAFLLRRIRFILCVRVKMDIMFAMGLFDYNGKLMDALRKFSDLVFYNIIFCVVSLPVITAGAGMCALCDGVRKLAADEESGSGVLRSFLCGFKRHFKRGTLLWAGVMAAAGTLSAVAFGIHLMPAGVRGIYVVTLYAGIFLFAFVYQYLFPLAAAYEDWRIGKVVKYSCLLAIASLPQTLLSMAVTGVFIYVTLILNWNVFRFGIFLWCSCGFAVCAYLNAFFFLRVQRKIKAEERR